jgi:hypothetical protein
LVVSTTGPTNGFKISTVTSGTGNVSFGI